MIKTSLRNFIFIIISVVVLILSLQNIYAHNSPSQWAISDVEKAIKYNLTPENILTNYQGYITREEFCEVSLRLYYALGGNEVKIQFKNPFVDTENRDVINAYYLGLVEGITKNQFVPYRIIPREEIAVMFYRVIKAVKPELNLSTPHTLMFDDVSEISEWALHEIRYMNSIGIINGIEDNILAPKKATTKEQSIVLSLRVFEQFFENKSEYSTGFFWEVMNENNTVYLLGSLHTGHYSLYPLNSTIESAYEKSNILIVDTMPTEEEVLNYDIAQKFIYSDETNIKHHIPSQLCEELSRALISLGQNISFIEKFKPWVLSLIIQEYDYVNQGYSASLGIDYYFMSKALREENKKIIKIEDIESRINNLSDLSYNLQEALLKKTLKELKYSEQMYSQLINSWKSGNTKEAEKVLFKAHEDAPEISMINKILYEERNNVLTEKIISYIDDEDNNIYFVTIGAEHLLGETGIISSLESKGYELKRIIN